MLSPLIAFRSGLPIVRLRWITVAVMLLSLLVHLTVLDWIKGDLILPALDDDADQVISITLPAPPAISRAPRATVRQPATVAPAAAEITHESTPVADPAVPAMNPAATAAATAAATTAPANTAPATTASAAPANTAPANTASAANDEVDKQHGEELAVTAAEDAQPPLFDRVSLPPAAELGYTFTAVKAGRKIEGHATISWQLGPTQYVISGEAGVLFFTVLNYKSTGSVDALGITPELYVEKRLRKSETNTHFHRERKEISFSASTNAYPIKGGEQDRASVIWQIAALGRGDSAKFVPGLAFELFVAGTRTASDWRIYVNGKQTLDVAGGPTEAWHLTLMPSKLGFEKQFEVWLAPDKEWYPVRLRYADNDAGYLDMMLTKLDMRK